MEGKPYSRRLQDLEDRFEQLDPLIPEGHEKEAISVLHGIVQELLRSLHRGGGAPSTDGPTLADIAELHRRAPPMEGESHSTPLSVGARAPDLSLQDGNGRLVSLHDFRGRPVILVFYPLDWSPSCSDQLSLYQAESGEFDKYAAQLLAVSVDSIYSHGAWAAVRGLSFPLLADFQPKGEVARMYGVYRGGDGTSDRALFVIDGQGVIRWSYVSPVGVNPGADGIDYEEATIRLVGAHTPDVNWFVL